MYAKYLPIALIATTILLVNLATAVPQGFPSPSTIESMPCNRNEDCSSKFPNSQCGIRRTCECTKDHIEEGTQCLPKISDFDTECQIHAQCAMGIMGELSRCSESNKRCECYDTRGHGRNSTMHYRNTCYLRVGLGDRCDISEQCKASIGPEQDVRCDQRTRTCQCGEGRTCEQLPGAASSLEKSVTLLLIAFVAMKIIH